jgi:hypothetical protein
MLKFKYQTSLQRTNGSDVARIKVNIPDLQILKLINHSKLLPTINTEADCVTNYLMRSSKSSYFLKQPKIMFFI